MALLKPVSVLINKRKKSSNSSNNRGMNTSFIREIKQKVGGVIYSDPVKKPTQSKPSDLDKRRITISSRKKTCFNTVSGS